MAALIAWIAVVRVDELVKDGAKRRRLRRSSILDKLINANKTLSMRSRPPSRCGGIDPAHPPLASSAPARHMCADARPRTPHRHRAACQNLQDRPGGGRHLVHADARL